MSCLICSRAGPSRALPTKWNDRLIDVCEVFDCPSWIEPINPYLSGQVYWNFYYSRPTDKRFDLTLVIKRRIE